MWMVALTLAVAGVVAWLAVTRWTRVDDRVSRAMIAVGAFLAVAGPTLTFVVNPARAEAARMEIPLFRAIKKHEPALYETLRDDKMDRGNAKELALLFRVRKHTAQLLAKYGPHASDESLHEFLTVAVGFMELLSGRGQTAIFDQPSGAGVDIDAARGLPNEAVHRLLSAYGAVIESGAASPDRQVDAAAADALIRQASDRAAASLAGYDATPALMTMEMYREILKLRPAECGLAARRLLQRAEETGIPGL
jgi:hypothetical protein